MNFILAHTINRLRDELLKTAAISFVAASASTAGAFVAHWAVNKWHGEEEDSTKDDEKTLEESSLLQVVCSVQSS